MRGLLISATAAGLALVPTVMVGQVLTSQYNNLRTGTILEEKTLTPQNVNARQFGKLGAFKVDGAVFAQPLFVPALEIPGKGKHDVIFVATEHDSVYAFDAYRTADPPLWQVSLLEPGGSARPVRERDVDCPFISPELGITSTPVIDLKTGTLYVLARTMSVHTASANEYFQKLHALSITTGAERFGGPKLITASVPGKGAGSAGGRVEFNALRENQRASLLLVNDMIYLAWASSCDVDPYHGWVMAYDAPTLAQRAVLNVTPDGTQGGIWESDTGPGADANGNVYLPTGNGTFDAWTGGRDYGDSVLKLGLQGRSIAVLDYFTPFDQAPLSDRDADVGSSGPLILPDQPGPHRHLLLQPTKSGTLYVINRDQMGKFHKDADAVVQTVRMGGEGYGAVAFWNGHLYFASSDDFLTDYAISNGHVSVNAKSMMKFENPGATPSVSAYGDNNGVVWALATKVWNGRDKPAVLYAFDAKKIDKPIYTSEDNSTRDHAATAMRFAIPIVVNGHVYFGARGEVDVYGLLK